MADRLPDALEGVEALPLSAITVTTAPLALETDAEVADMIVGGLPTIVRSPEPWLTEAPDADMIVLWPIVPFAVEAVVD